MPKYGIYMPNMLIGNPDPTLSKHPTEDLSRSQINLTQLIPGANQMARGLEEAVRELVMQLQSKQDTPISSGDFRVSPSGFEWLRCKPSKIYHLKSWVQSLDDTPEVFHSKQTAFAPLRRGIIRYLTGGDSSESPNAPSYNRETVYEIIRPHDLEFLSTFDFKLNDDFTFTKEEISLTDSGNVSHQRELLTSLNDSVKSSYLHEIVRRLTSQAGRSRHKIQNLVGKPIKRDREGN
jgi:hypothetical protein